MAMLSGLDRMAKWLMRSGDVLFPGSRASYSWLATHVSGRVLDVGCSFGTGTALIASQHVRTVGIDVDFGSVHMARGLYPWLDWWMWDISKAPICQTPEYDYVIGVESFEHIRDQRSAMKNMLRAAGLEVIITTPNPAYTGGQSGCPEHTHEFEPKELSELVRSLGATITHIYEVGTFKEVTDASKSPDLMYVISRAGGVA